MVAVNVYRNQWVLQPALVNGYCILYKSMGAASLHKSMGAESLCKSMGTASLCKSMFSELRCKSLCWSMDDEFQHRSVRAAFQHK